MHAVCVLRCTKLLGPLTHAGGMLHCIDVAAAADACWRWECAAVQYSFSSCECRARSTQALHHSEVFQWLVHASGMHCIAVMRLQQLVHAGAENALQCSMNSSAVNAAHQLHCSDVVPAAGACQVPAANMCCITLCGCSSCCLPCASWETSGHCLGTCGCRGAEAANRHCLE